MIWLRRILIEMWAMVVFAAIIGFLGPFGTYMDGDFAARTGRWWMQLMGAYVLVRPSILLWRTVAVATALPLRPMVCSGVFLSSFPLALLWSWSADAFFHSLNGFAGILPFAILSAIGVLIVTVWAQRVDDQLGHAFVRKDAEGVSHHPIENLARQPDAEALPLPEQEDSPRLLRRLAPGFRGPVVALQSEDHYVRVHGASGSELVLMRLRDAIAEMEGRPGEQVHRSWWIADGGIASVEADGRSRSVTLINGAVAPIARDSVSRLEHKGFLTGQSA